MKPNPKNFKPFFDPKGGEWIKITTGKFKDVVWRPVDIKLEEDNKLSFSAEFLSPAPEDMKVFEQLAGSIIPDSIKEAFVNEN